MSLSARGRFGALLIVFFFLTAGPWTAGPARAQGPLDYVDLLNPAGAALDGRVGSILPQVLQARQLVEKLRNDSGANSVALSQAVQNLNTLERDLEFARIQTLAESSGVSARKIMNMRNSGQGWGVIAQNLGLHPGILGVGHANQGSSQSFGNSSGYNSKGNKGNKNKSGGKSKGKAKGKKK